MRTTDCKQTDKAVLIPSINEWDTVCVSDGRVDDITTHVEMRSEELLTVLECMTSLEL